MSRCYYKANISTFLQAEDNQILGELARHHEFSLEELQRDSWLVQIHKLQEWLISVPGTILFEYSIPRMGKRIDCVILSQNIIFAIEFKVGADAYLSHQIDQVIDYALDLKNFHEESHSVCIVPILICTEASKEYTDLSFDKDKIAHPVLLNGSSLSKVIATACMGSLEPPIDADRWVNSIYKPTPTIIEAAQALYRGHKVEEISRSEAGAENLTRTAAAIHQIIAYSQKHKQKSICFLTGVPGSGKTLAGLNLANSWHNVDNDEHAVFLSGNGPLVEVLREALARSEAELAVNRGESLRKGELLSRVKLFIQNIHHFRDDALESKQPPLEHVVVFDEAQRAWTQHQTAAFMKTKKGIIDFSQSEPEFLISVMNRHHDWATIVCLVGGGQEINTGEAGIQEWFDSLERAFPEWQIYISDNLYDFEYTQGKRLFPNGMADRIHITDDLHLSVSIRSFRSEKVAAFVKAVLDFNLLSAQNIYKDIKDSYPIVLTRDISTAKKWLKTAARGSEGYGLVASSGAIRLKPFAINVHDSIQPKVWFLNTKADIRSCFFLEEVATEFDIQGLELDWVCVAWDANLRFDGKEWLHKAFRGTRWQDIKDPATKLYLKNAYRVLLTRARQGMIIFIPEGDGSDNTRLPAFYDHTYNLFRAIGLPDIGC
jgi:hypothetical protein